MVFVDVAFYVDLQFGTDVLVVSVCIVYVYDKRWFNCGISDRYCCYVVNGNVDWCNLRWQYNFVVDVDCRVRLSFMHFGFYEHP